MGQGSRDQIRPERVPWAAPVVPDSLHGVANAAEGKRRVGLQANGITGRGAKSAGHGEGGAQAAEQGRGGGKFHEPAFRCRLKHAKPQRGTPHPRPTQEPRGPAAACDGCLAALPVWRAAPLRVERGRRADQSPLRRDQIRL